jgi:magnesium transporter
LIKAIYCNTQDHVFERVNTVEQIKHMIHDPNQIFWLDLQKPDQQELDAIAEKFHLHPLAIEDASHEHQRPKVEDYDHFLFLVFYTVSVVPGSAKLNVCELDMFVGPNYLITVHGAPIKELNEVEQRWKRNDKKLEVGVGILLYSLLDSVVDDYFPAMDDLVEQAEELENRIFLSEGRNGNITFDLLELRKRFVEFRRIVNPERDVLNVLTNRDNPLFKDGVVVYFRDIYDHITRLADTLDLYHDQMSSAMDANLAIASNELNQVMRTLTSASIILMFDALIAGIYGMNFVGMPELHWSFGYPYAIALMLVGSILLYLYFKRRHWV